MNAEKFIKAAKLSGYSTSERAARAYTEHVKKEEYTDQDFIELYHTSMRWPECAADKGLREAWGINGKTTAMRNGIEGNSGPGQDWWK
ncbi:hypothetical protein [Muricomes intestini]|jgi:hypothetical protein|uniref:hypothetical protein n=1 Tax=Muricomes intestini TaxID=1796634 RepID=UPI000E9066C9|nr:hypothetical protein [Lachnospiraceae bacterium]